MNNKLIKHIFVLTALTLSLNACSSFFDKDNTPTPAPLVDFKQEANVQPLWYTSTGSGIDNEYLKLAPAISGNTIYTASKDGTVSANDKSSGKTRWYVNTSATITGGVAATNNIILVGTQEGYTLALNPANGSQLWKASSSSEILAPAAATQDIALVKAIDGSVTALSVQNGHTLWHYQEPEPSLILRGSSAPQISHGDAIVGFENGNLTKLALRDGKLIWQQTIAESNGIFAIQRMVDIDADPIVIGDRIYAATYQGQVSALDFGSGRSLWTHDISSYSGIASDGKKVFVSDAQSHVWAFDAENGTVAWEQDKLTARTITGPATIGQFVVVGDAEGYLHWMSKQDGHFVARTYVNSSGIIATPIVDNNVLYVYTKDGHLAAYTV